MATIAAMSDPGGGKAASSSSSSGGVDRLPDEMNDMKIKDDKVQSCKIMIRSNNVSQKTYYEIIGVKEDAAQEQIRKTYRSVILDYHPDKVHNLSETCIGEQELGNRFLEVQNAWKILGDPKSRALYDNELRALRQEDVTAEDVCLGDMNVEDSGDGGFELSYGCRCGDYFSVESSELVEMGYQIFIEGSEISLRTIGNVPASVVLPCGSCSLKVRLFIDVNTTFLRDS